MKLLYMSRWKFLCGYRFLTPLGKCQGEWWLNTVRACLVFLFIGHSTVMPKGLVWLSEAMSHARQGHPRQTGHREEFWQSVVHWRRQWHLPEVSLLREPHAQYEKAKQHDSGRRALRWEGVQSAAGEKWRAVAVRWVGGIAGSGDTSLSKLWGIVEGRGALRATAHEVTKSQTRLSAWATVTAALSL